MTAQSVQLTVQIFFQPAVRLHISWRKLVKTIKSLHATGRGRRQLRTQRAVLYRKTGQQSQGSRAARGIENRGSPPQGTSRKIVIDRHELELIIWFVVHMVSFVLICIADGSGSLASTAGLPNVPTNKAASNFFARLI